MDDVRRTPLRRRPWRVLLFALLAFVACSRSFDSLPRPLLSSTGGVGTNCTSTVAVDGRGDIWTESGCEARSSGVQHRGRLTEAQGAKFRAALASVEAVADIHAEDVKPACAQPLERITLARGAPPDREWWLCPQGDGRRPPPFEGLFEAMR